jgi:hypothetical protein
VLALVALHAVIGMAAGWLAWDVARVLQVRLGKMPVQTTSS